jgi:hypothetical protein
VGEKERDRDGVGVSGWVDGREREGGWVGERGRVDGWVVCVSGWMNVSVAWCGRREWMDVGG